jgi:hypothetical protein
MAINKIFNYFDILTFILLCNLLGYFILLVIEATNYLKILIIFELLLLIITLIFLININENIDHLVLLILVLVGGESCLALSIIFPFIIK